jgi:hypothetical protein
MFQGVGGFAGIWRGVLFLGWGVIARGGFAIKILLREGVGDWWDVAFCFSLPMKS